jgi:hypothetical protein
VPAGLSLLGALVPLIIDQRNKSLEKDKQLDTIYLEIIRLKLETKKNETALIFFCQQ